jgi:hypothetical protein
MNQAYTSSHRGPLCLPFLLKLGIQNHTPVYSRTRLDKKRHRVERLRCEGAFLDSPLAEERLRSVVPKII